MQPHIDQDGNLQYDLWVTTDTGLSVRRDALGIDDPENLYNHIRAAGIIPEHFGIVKYDISEFDGFSREQLCCMIVELHEEISHLYRCI
jgi:hypothetical protein